MLFHGPGMVAIVLGALAEDAGSVPVTPASGDLTLFWFRRHLYTCGAHTYKQVHG